MDQSVAVITGENIKTWVQRGTKKKRKMQQVMEANFYAPLPAALW